jgi:hypothetical protein
MSGNRQQSGRQRSALFVVTLGLGLATGLAMAADYRVTLSGDQEVPPVKTAAMATATISVGDDKSVTGKITTRGIAGVAAHIHEAARGANGPVVVTLEKTADDVWSVPVGSHLTDAQLASLKSGLLYVNVHSAANKAGEIRAQLTK